MKTIDLKQALPQIQQLLEMAATGQEIMITQNNQPMVKLVSPNALISNHRTWDNN
jgi:prevent-host-death family protein